MELNKKVEHEILNAVKNVDFGSVEITIHNSRVVQIERKTKVRFDSKSETR
ncbi:MAG: YezD family protein [Candidatus Omnitrophica bacterium]|nr:YezD family protein [Candidatus Omnitrophota bacterium]